MQRQYRNVFPLRQRSDEYPCNILEESVLTIPSSIDGSESTICVNIGIAAGWWVLVFDSVSLRSNLIANSVAGMVS